MLCGRPALELNLSPDEARLSDRRRLGCLHHFLLFSLDRKKTKLGGRRLCDSARWDFRSWRCSPASGSWREGKDRSDDGVRIDLFNGHYPTSPIGKDRGARCGCVSLRPNPRRASYAPAAAFVMKRKNANLNHPLSSLSEHQRYELLKYIDSIFFFGRWEGGGEVGMKIPAGFILHSLFRKEKRE